MYFIFVNKKHPHPIFVLFDSYLILNNHNSKLLIKPAKMLLILPISISLYLLGFTENGYPLF